MNHKKGFTIIELLLAMSFLSTLMLAVAMTVVRIGEIYNKGLTVKEVNIAGRSLSAELEETIGRSQSIDLTQSANKYVKQDWGGRLCIGRYTYVWNYGKTLSDSSTSSTNSNVYSTNEKVRFVKVVDGAGTYCIDPSKKVNNADAIELLPSGDRDIALHNFSITTQLSATDGRSRQGLYYISYLVGTNEQAAISSTGSNCKTPDNIDADTTYCSINEFNIVARSSNALQ